jgi:hypothetical protein
MMGNADLVKSFFPPIDPLSIESKILTDEQKKDIVEVFRNQVHMEQQPTFRRFCHIVQPSVIEDMFYENHECLTDMLENIKLWQCATMVKNITGEDAMDGHRMIWRGDCSTYFTLDHNESFMEEWEEDTLCYISESIDGLKEKYELEHDRDAHMEAVKFILGKAKIKDMPDLLVEDIAEFTMGFVEAVKKRVKDYRDLVKFEYNVLKTLLEYKAATIDHARKIVQDASDTQE